MENLAKNKKRRAVYMDYNATTPIDPRVAHQMSKCMMFDGTFGNPASRSHVFGWEAEELVEKARVQTAEVICADPREIVWTSGATESDNLAIKGVAELSEKRHIVTTTYEHKAVLDTCKYLELQGFDVSYVSPDGEGIVQPETIAKSIRPDTVLCSVMHVNNEIGVINDVASIGEICRDMGVLMHVDAAQSYGKIPIDVSDTAIDLLSISGHKIYGPKGIGALYVRRDPPVALQACMHGGGHEMGFRSGTLPTHQIVGLGIAAKICSEEMEVEDERIFQLRNRLWSHLKQVPGSRLNGSLEHRSSSNLNVGFESVDGETLLMAMDDVAVSSGSACTSASVEPSYVLKAIGLEEEIASSSIRLSLGRYTTTEDVDFAAQRVADIVQKLRKVN